MITDFPVDTGKEDSANLQMTRSQTMTVRKVKSFSQLPGAGQDGGADRETETPAERRQALIEAKGKLSSYVKSRRRSPRRRSSDKSWQQSNSRNPTLAQLRTETIDEETESSVQSSP